MAARLSALRVSRLYLQEDSWYSFLLEAESTPGPYFGWQDWVGWKIRWLYRKSNRWPPGLQHSAPTNWATMCLHRVALILSVRGRLCRTRLLQRAADPFGAGIQPDCPERDAFSPPLSAFLGHNDMRCRCAWFVGWLSGQLQASPAPQLCSTEQCVATAIQYLVPVFYPRNRPWRPIGLLDVKDPTLSR
jgi:hypothetical protein